MPYAAIEALGVITAMALLGGFGLAGMKMIMSYRLQRLRATAPGGRDVERLTGEVEELSEQLELARQEIADLHERVDFTERVLAAKEPEARQLEKPKATPV